MEALTDVQRAALARIAAAWEAPPYISRADWLTSNLVLPQSVSANPGLYDLQRFPYWRGVIDASQDPAVEKIVIMAATQVGKTLMEIAIALAMASLSPVPAMLGTPDKDSLRELRDRVYEICEASEALRHAIPPPHQRNDRWIEVGRMKIYLGYSRNTQTLSGKSCGLVLKTEIDRWKKTKTHGDPSAMIEERVKAFHRSLIIEESTPSDENSRIAAAYDASDRRRFLVPCPLCGHFQELWFFPRKKGKYAGRGGVHGLRDGDGGAWLKPDDVIKSAFFVCERGGCRIDNDEKSGMIEQGLWVPSGQRVSTKGKLLGTPHKTRRVWGGRLNSLYADTVSFGKMAARYLEAREDESLLQVWWNDWHGQRRIHRAKAPRWKELWRRLQYAHDPGIAPAWAIFLTAGVDVGKEYCRWVVRAWGEGGTSALVDWGTTHIIAAEDGGVGRGSHIAALRASVIDRGWKLSAANVAGRTQLRVRLAAIDCGFIPHDVHDFTRTLGDSARRVRQIVGKDEIKGGIKWRSYVVERSARTGKPYAGGQTRWEVNRAIFNEDLHARWRQPLESPGAWFLTNAPLDRCEQYMRELTAEAPVKTFDRNGREKTVWQKVDANVPNHYFDCEAYALAAADMLTMGDWSNLAGRLRTKSADQSQTNPKPSPPTKPGGMTFLERPGGWI